MPDSAPILTFAEARLPLDATGFLTGPIDLAVLPDELLLIDLAEPRRLAAFADAVCGCLPGIEGGIAFLRRDWRLEPPEKAQALRGRLGRAFSDDAWLPWLTVSDNVILGPHYHTRIPSGTLRAEAARVAAWFGLPGLPVDFPEAMTVRDLARAALVRAFLGTPRLVVLEDPTAVLGAEVLPGLLAAIRSVRDDGGAVLWLTHDGALVRERALPATQRWRLVGSRLAAVSERVG
jgi:phospholipid/cholesterol/gamma-HCH transport system ATP-binding protein